MAGLNLKTVFGADTKGFEQGAKTVKQGIKDLEGVSGSALSDIGDLLGVNTDKVSKMTSAFVGLGAKLRDCGSAGGEAIGSLITSMGALGTAVAGIGIAGAVAGFKSLQSEAENFENTIDGLNMKMAQAAWLSTYKQAMHDANSEVGKSIAEAENEITKGWQNFWTTIKSGMALGTYSSVAGSSRGAAGQSWIASFASAAQQNKDSNILAAKAEVIGERQAELEKKKLDLTVQVAEWDKQINELREIATNSENSLAVRTEAEAKARELIRQKYTQQIYIARQEASLDNELHSLTSNTVEESKTSAQLKATVLNLESQEEVELKSLNRLHKSLSTEAGKTSKAVKETASSISAMIPDLTQASRAIDTSILYGIDTSTTLPSSAGTGLQAALDAEFSRALTVNVTPKFNVEEVRKAVIDITPVIEDAFDTMSENVGTLIGDLLTGEDAWSNFGQSVMSSLGDMAMAVGKVAIQTGMAMKGINKALTFGDPTGTTAIVAGTALVALGAAVKASMSNVANGNYSSSSSSSVASSSYSSATDSSYAREMTINVSGTWDVEGSKLVAVLNNESKRSTVTT